MSCSCEGVVKLEYLLTELVVLLVRMLDLADDILDRPPDFLDFPPGVLILAIGLCELPSKVVGLLLEEHSTRPLLIVRVAVRSLLSIVVLG
jgi:hypothetical protein